MKQQEVSGSGRISSSQKSHEKWEECICKVGVNNILHLENRIMRWFLSTAHVSVKPHTIQLTLPLPYTGSWMTGRAEEGRTFTQTHTMNWTWTKTKSPQPLLVALCPLKCWPPSVALLHKHFYPPWSYSTQMLSVGKLAMKQLWFGQTLSLISLFFHWLNPAVSWRRKERDNRCWWWQKSARASLW